MIPKTYEWKGQRHTLKEWSKITGISVQTLYGRIERNGLRIGDAFKDRRTLGLQYEGKRYTMAGLADALGIALATLQRKLKSGMTVDEIATWARETRAIREERKRMMQLHSRGVEHRQKGESICWDCRRNVCGCSWARNLVPVEGFAFVERITNDGPRKTITSCPKYIFRGDRRARYAMV